MKRALVVSFGLIMLGSYAGCLPDEATPTGTGGSQGTAGTGSPGSAGTQGTAGTAGTGVAGTVGTGGNDSSGVSGSQGGDSSGTAGNGTAGSGTAGNGTAGNSQAGTGGTGTSRGGAGGTSNAGTGGTGTSRGGAGGTSTAGTGGSSRGGTGGTGTAGAGGTGSGGLPAIGDLFPVTSTTVGSFDGRLVVMPCGDDNASGTDCGGGGAYYSTAGSTTAARIQCAGGSLTAEQIFNVGGEAGKVYTVTIHVYGVSEPKNYGTGVTREAGTGRPALTPTGAGATPTPWGTAAGGHTYPVSDYNSSEIRVCRTRTCAAGDETNVYYLNADTREGHWTYVLNYMKQIQVVGGGSIRMKNYDRNCRQIKNCGPEGEPATACAGDANARVISVSAARPMPASAAAASGGLLQPNLDPARGAGASGQWSLIDVVSVDSVQ